MQIVASKQVKKLDAEIVRSAILKEGQRSDGRNTKQIRPIEAIVGFLPRTHGSALFTRGETQAICTTTLGTKDAEQMIDGLTGLSYERFMLHYNFPPYSVGEVGRSEEHTSELQSLMRISYAVFCLKKKKNIMTLRRG